MKTERLNLRVTPALRDALEQEAIEQDRHLSWVIQQALEQFVQRVKMRRDRSGRRVRR